MGVVKRVYDDLGLSMTAPVGESIAQESRRLGTESSTAHEWSFASLGLDRDHERARFAAYCTEFSIAEEVR
jgi:hypothetical protein